MIILCKKCGNYGKAAQVSPDIASINCSQGNDTPVVFKYMHNGEIAEVFFLSHSFMASKKIFSTSEDLPDEYPDWVGELKMVCEKCFAPPTTGH